MWVALLIVAVLAFAAVLFFVAGASPVPARRDGADADADRARRRLAGVATDQTRAEGSMSWKGWEDFDPERRRPLAEALKRQPRVKNAQPTEVDGHLFPSKREADRYGYLRTLEAIGEIEALRLQFRFPLEVNGVLLGHYVADFTYRQGGRTVVEDAKGMRTEMYRWKRRHFEAQYSIQIHEV